MVINPSTKHCKISSMMEDKYTQQEWDKAIGWGTLPENKKLQKEEECSTTQDTQNRLTKS
jgi:hypothetical protein